MTPDAVIGAGALWIAIPLALLAGLVSFLSPCILPLVPGYLGFLGGAAGATAPSAQVAAPASQRRRMLLGVLLFIAGFTVVFVAYTVIGGAASVFFLEWGDLITRILGGVVVLMGLVFLGLFGFAQRQYKMQVDSTAGLIGAPLLGFTLAIGWAPCTGPTLGAIISVGWTLGDPWRAGLLGVAYSLGLGIPFLLVALGFGWATSATAFMRRHIRTVNIVGGALLIVLGVLMVTGVWTQIMSRLTAVMSSVILPL
ncbi:cytochrome c biogenesis CcdA family protein [Microbacterium sp. nov. GSS16]|uniref:cytochrome c biogenesis CcdA family protein n=1 Tax=Microbacterium sp. nov. GSS16 TaxID=3019890 RepID=UPI002306B712|nr:cytochrome c biogenesis protein CcdA [Microbacterium sp. nov. GSS16]WCD92976.1 cytochrome c biogenesis protein CcdA [Microbacterium sp. nov. GSS16]